ncbi:MAG TPA: hypothetical protein PKY59_15390, partial [Pyrinomonadaceae bacterium]|nr:hypothetical protein [Pyrinomonadaceae bacterium]
NLGFLTLPAPQIQTGEKLDLDADPWVILIFYKPDPAKPTVKTLSIPVTQVGVVTTLESLVPEKTQAKGADDAELYVSSDVTTAFGSGPVWNTDFKYEKKYGKIGKVALPFLYAPFANLHYNSKIPGDTDKFNVGLKFSNSFGFSPNKPLSFESADKEFVENREVNNLLAEITDTESKQKPRYSKVKRQRDQRQYFLYEGTAEFESDWDFRVRNVISSQTLSYLLHPLLIKNKGKLIGNITLTPLAGAEVGWNLRNPTDRTDRGIFRLKTGANLTMFVNNPVTELPFETIVWSNTYTQRWAIAKQFAYDKDTNGNLIEKSFGKAPFSYFKSVLEFKTTKYVSPTITYEWGNDAPLFNRIRHKMKFGLTYSFKTNEGSL